MAPRPPPAWRIFGSALKQAYEKAGLANNYERFSAETKIALCVALESELGADDIKAAKELSDTALRFAEMYVNGAKLGLQIHAAKTPAAQARARNAGRQQAAKERGRVLPGNLLKRSNDFLSGPEVISGQRRQSPLL